MERGPEIPVHPTAILRRFLFPGPPMMRRRRNVDNDAAPPAGGTITGIVASPRAPGRFTVMVDGKAANTLGLAAIERLGLSIGATTEGREAIIAREEGLLRTYDRAVMILAARGRAAKDLERQLVRKGEPLEFARLAVERLLSEGFIDDESYARSFVRSKSAGAGLARFRLKQELGRQGVERAIVDEAIDDVFEEEEIDEVAAATALACRRSQSLKSAGPELRRRRLYSFLARRGYSPDIIGQAIRATINAGVVGENCEDDRDLSPDASDG
jgi:regulatory protein